MTTQAQQLWRERLAAARFAYRSLMDARVLLPTTTETDYCARYLRSFDAADDDAGGARVNGGALSLDLLHGVRFVASDDQQYCETIWPDGARVPAAPEDTDAYRETAAACGYGADTWCLCKEHELLHSVLCQRLFGWPHSPTLRGVAAPSERVPQWLAEWEEALVLGVQALLNGTTYAGTSYGAGVSWQQALTVAREAVRQ